jgi:aryl-alcohol dehydrogenase-like predicted oxidoreductase
MGPGANQVGLSKLHIIDSVDDSLKRLNLSHIDLLYIHGVDPLTPLEETMRGLEAVVSSGKVRYLGISNHPAWMVMKANGIAEKNGWTKFSASQNYYTIASRDIEREIVPMLKSENIALMPWSPLAGGFLSGKYTREKEIAGNSRRDSFDFPPLNKSRAFDIIDKMSEIGKRYNCSVARIALAWMLTKSYVTSIIIGAKTPDQLKDNIEATKIRLAEEDIQELENISALTPEYPAWMVDRQLSNRWPEIK